MDYFELQEAVFNYLWNKHQKDNSFTFSVRQVASKGAEKNHFIGTQKSGYFGFTCWDIPVYYPGSSSDLTNFIFIKGDKTVGVKFQYTMSKSATGIQSEGDLEFGVLLLDKLKKANVAVVENAPGNKMLYFQVFPPTPMVDSVGDLMQHFELLYSLLNPHIEQAIAEIKKNKSEWQASKFTQLKFDTLITKMHQRIQKYATASPQELAQLPDEDETIVNNNILRPALNTILYGPPGTGKTYNTINKAVAIANPDFNLKDASRNAIKEEYKRLCAAGQIHFVTFHQSMSYEDFIEGIKPVEPKETDSFLKYKIQDGIFKRLVEQAAYVPDVQEAGVYLSEDAFSKAFFYSLTFNTSRVPYDKVIYRYCLDHNCIALNVADGINVSGKSEAEIKTEVRSNGLESDIGVSLSKFIHHLKKDNYILLCDGDSACRAIGKVTGDYEYKPNGDITPDHFRPVEWLVKDVQIPREQLYAEPFTYGIERLDRDTVKKEFFTKSTVAVQPKLVRKNHVLIIDEINRGNVSQIFGELITLIEEDKRAGKTEALKVTLPYSKSPFSVPDNLYLIGTMNTADRSVEALDTALRRRFIFEEMMPKPELLASKRLMWQFLWKHKDDLWVSSEFQEQESRVYPFFGIDDTFESEKKDLWHKMEEEGMKEEQVEHFAKFSFSGIDLQLMLEAINERLQALLTKDHTIGHAWLMDIYSLADLQRAFKNRILPLLQEYFYNNYAKIGLVLGDRFIEQKQVKKGLFAKFKDDQETANDYEGKTIYTLVDPYTLDLEAFRSIYP